MQINLTAKKKSFDHDYRDIIKSIVRGRKNAPNENITFKSLATACRIQPAYLSRAIALKAHLNLDQLWNVCQTLELTETETQFLLMLSSYQQSAVSSRKKELKKVIKAYEEKLKDTAHLFSQPKSDKVPDGFHLDVVSQLVLQYFVVEQHCSDVSEIGQKLGITSQKVSDVIQRLLSYDLIIEKDDGFVPNHDVQTHLSSQSDLFPTFFRNRMLFALDHLDNVRNSDAVHFSVMFTSNFEFQKNLKTKLHEVIKWAEKEVDNYQSEEVYILNIHSNQLSNIHTQYEDEPEDEDENSDNDSSVVLEP